MPCSVTMAGSVPWVSLEVEAFLLLHVLVGEAVEAAAGEVLAQRVEDRFAVAQRAGAEELDHEQVVVAVHHQPADAVALAVDHAPGVGDLVQLEDVAAQRDRLADLAREPGGVDRHVGVASPACAGRSASGRCRSRGRSRSPSTPTTSTMLPGLGRCAGFSTSRWKIHGWVEFQAFLRLDDGQGFGHGRHSRGFTGVCYCLPRRGVTPRAVVVITDRLASDPGPGAAAGQPPVSETFAVRRSALPFHASLHGRLRRSQGAELSMETIGTPLLWLVFGGVVIIALLADLVLMRHGGPHKVSFKEAAWWSIGWVALALAFNGWLWWYTGQRFGAQAGNRHRHGVPDRLPGREGAGGRQHLRVPDAVQLFRGAGDAAPARAGDRHHRRHRAARDPDLRRRAAAGEVPLGALRVRRVPAVHRHQDVARRRPGARPGIQPGAALADRAHPVPAPLPRQRAVGGPRHAAASSPRCSSSS